MADKSNPYATRFRQDVADKIERYRDEKEEETGVKPGKSQAIHDLAVIGLESEAGDGTPRERELRREVEQLENEKSEVYTFAWVGAGAVLGVFLFTASTALESRLSIEIMDTIGLIGVALALLSTFAFFMVPFVNTGFSAIQRYLNRE